LNGSQISPPSKKVKRRGVRIGDLDSIMSVEKKILDILVDFIENDVNKIGYLDPLNGSQI
jgi:hypothetical protein